MSALVPHVPAALVDKLAKVAGLLGSDHDGERAAAAYRATAIIREAGLTWRQVIEAAGPRVVEREPEQPRSGGPQWYSKALACAACPGRLTAWERSFLDSLLADGPYRGPLSPKQEAALDRIWRKAGAS